LNIKFLINFNLNTFITIFPIFLLFCFCLNFQLLYIQVMISSSFFKKEN
jgi:hypothetical protein